MKRLTTTPPIAIDDNTDDNLNWSDADDNTTLTGPLPATTKGRHHTEPRITLTIGRPPIRQHN